MLFFVSIIKQIDKKRKKYIHHNDECTFSVPYYKSILLRQSFLFWKV
jgi:hypothetical protein